MHLEGKHTFAAPRETIWELLMDPNTLSKALPGSEGLEQTADDEYRGTMNVRVGPVQGKFSGTVKLLDIQAPEQYRIIVDGKGAPGFIRGEGHLRLEEHADTTILVYAGDLQVGGRIAGVGQRVLDSTARSLTRQSLEALDQQLLAANAPAPELPASTAMATAMATAGATPPAPVTAAPPTATGPSPSAIAAEVAKDVTRDVLADYMPATARQWLVPVAVTLGLFLLCGLCKRLGRAG